MKKVFISLLMAVSAIMASAESHTQYVNPLIGTQTDDTGALSGSTFPGACYPLGLVQLSPDTEKYVTLARATTTTATASTVSRTPT